MKKTSMKVKMEKNHEQENMKVKIKWSKSMKVKKRSTKVKMEGKHEGMLLSPQFIGHCLSQLFKFKTL